MGVVTKGNLDRLTGITGHDKTGGPPVALVISTAEASDFFADEAFAMAGCALLRAHTLSDAEELCKSRNPDLLVLPLRLEGDSLIPYLTECKAEKDLSVIVVAESDQINDAAEAMRAGADDCLFHPFSNARLTRTLRAVSQPRGARASEPADRRVRAVDGADWPPAESAARLPDPVHGMIGTTPEMRRLLRRVDAAAGVSDPVLIHGEVGTGRSSFARAIHDASSRATGPLVTLDCAATDPATLERDLSPGTANGAFARATRGTLLVDRVDELDPKLQARLLPLLSPDAEPDTPRVIATLSRNPAQALSEGRLREDFYYALNVLSFALPPLRMRGGDVGNILLTKIREIAANLGREAPTIQGPALSVLSTYRWPGNLTELVSTLRGVLLTCGDVISTRDLPSRVMEEESISSLRPQPVAAATSGADLAPLIGRPLAEIERAVIEATIAAQGGSIPRAAKVLDVSPSTIYRKRESWTKPE
jgi:two-component system repressor protein LuxO